ncbi:MAG: hypothetical protein OEY49_05955 [Candidatus Heimdallarchaeota archaeon]|nr:hypothetical protein [Candidatus Heimdallarchaeota archaeon]
MSIINPMSKFKTIRDKGIILQDSLTLFALMNFFLSLGFLMIIILGRDTMIPVFLLVEQDLGLVFIFLMYIIGIMDPITNLFIYIGWGVTGIYAKITYGSHASRKYFYAVISNFLIITIMIMMVIIPFFLLDIRALVLIVPLLLLVLFLVFIYFVGLPSLIGFLTLMMWPSQKKAHVEIKSVPFFLATDDITSKLPIKICPFKYKDINGCSFLGIKVGDYDTICNHVETYSNCSIYDKLFKRTFTKVEDDH